MSFSQTGVNKNSSLNSQIKISLLGNNTVYLYVIISTYFKYAYVEIKQIFRVSLQLINHQDCLESDNSATIYTVVEANKLPETDIIEINWFRQTWELLTSILLANKTLGV